MQFTRRLRQGVKDGSITCSVRIWQRPHVKAGGLYPMEEGQILVESVREIALEDVTGDLARRSGFLGVVDLLRVAKHGPGARVAVLPQGPLTIPYLA